MSIIQGVDVERQIAIRGQIFYLLNFLLLPGIAFLLLLFLWYRNKSPHGSLHRQHPVSAIRWALVGGCLLIAAPVSYLLIFSEPSANTVALLFAAWVITHGMLVLVGAHGPMRAASNRPLFF